MSILPLRLYRTKGQQMGIRSCPLRLPGLSEQHSTSFWCPAQHSLSSQLLKLTMQGPCARHYAECLTYLTPFHGNTLHHIQCIGEKLVNNTDELHSHGTTFPQMDTEEGTSVCLHLAFPTSQKLSQCLWRVESPSQKKKKPLQGAPPRIVPLSRNTGFLLQPGPELLMSKGRIWL